MFSNNVSTLNNEFRLLGTSSWTVSNVAGGGIYFTNQQYKKMQEWMLQKGWELIKPDTSGHRNTVLPGFTMQCLQTWAERGEVKNEISLEGTESKESEVLVLETTTTEEIKESPVVPTSEEGKKEEGEVKDLEKESPVVPTSEGKGKGIEEVTTTEEEIKVPGSVEKKGEYIDILAMLCDSLWHEIRKLQIQSDWQFEQIQIAQKKFDEFGEVLSKQLQESFQENGKKTQQLLHENGTLRVQLETFQGNFHLLKNQLEILNKENQSLQTQKNESQLNEIKSKQEASKLKIENQALVTQCTSYNELFQEGVKAEEEKQRILIKNKNEVVKNLNRLLRDFRVGACRSKILEIRKKVMEIEIENETPLPSKESRSGSFGWGAVAVLTLAGIGWYYAGAPGSGKMNEIGKGLLGRVGLV